VGSSDGSSRGSIRVLVPARLAAMAGDLEGRRDTTTPCLGKHEHQGSPRSDVLYVEALAAPDTINTIPDDTLRAFVDHGHVMQTMPADGA